MNADLLAYTADAALVLWGLAHVLPTRAVADGFGDIGADNRRILVMEWLAEGIAHIATGLLVVAIAAAGDAGNATAGLAYRVLASALIALAALTTITGARTPVIWFKICPLRADHRCGVAHHAHARLAQIPRTEHASRLFRVNMSHVATLETRKDEIRMIRWDVEVARG